MLSGRLTRIPEGNGKQESWPNQVTKRVCDSWSKDFVKRQPRSGRPGTKGPREDPSKVLRRRERGQ